MILRGPYAGEGQDTGRSSVARPGRRQQVAGCDRATVDKIVAMRQEALPIIIVREQRAAAVAQLKCWVGQRVANAETGKRWSNATVGNVAAHRIEC
jgi:hypothetical protein